jgi:hypothetical protein
MESTRHMETHTKTRLAQTGVKLAALLSKVHDPNKVGFGPSCKLIKCTKASSWCSNGSLIYALAETCKTSLFNASFNAFILELVIGPFRSCNRYLLVFVGWSTSIMVTVVTHFWVLIKKN